MNQKSNQKGSALIYILIAIALLAALTATFMDSSSSQTTSQNTFNTVAELNSQTNFIRSAIQECVLTYPAGDDALVGTDNIPYPINPSSLYLSVPGPNDQAQYLKCPGNPGNSNVHASIFGGTSGKFMPPPPNLFQPWQYYNGTDGVFFWTYTDKSDSYLATALAKLDDQFSECEADVISGAFNMTTAGAGGPVCAAGHKCFRVWVIAQPANVYQDATETGACP